MATRADRLGTRLDIVADNILILSSNSELGKITVWLFSVEATLRECVKDLSEFIKIKEYKRLPPNILSKPTIDREGKKNLAKHPNANYIYSDEIDHATLGKLVIYYKLLRPTNKKLYRRLKAITFGRNKVAHKLFRSKNIQTDFAKIFPKHIRNKLMKDILNDIINDTKGVLAEIKKVS